VSDSRKHELEVVRTYVILGVVPVALGLLLQMLLLPTQPAWGLFEIAGMVVAAVLCLGYALRRYVRNHAQR